MMSNHNSSTVAATQKMTFCLLSVCFLFHFILPSLAFVRVVPLRRCSTTSSSFAFRLYDNNNSNNSNSNKRNNNTPKNNPFDFFQREPAYQPRSTKPIEDPADSSTLYSNNVVPTPINTNNNNPLARFNPFAGQAIVTDDDEDDDALDLRSTTIPVLEADPLDMVQRIESTKAAVVGALVGSLAVAPLAFLHYTSNVPQWEWIVDMAAIQGALFAIVYRYTIRRNTNLQLNLGVVGAFVLTRTLSSIQVSPYCSALPLNCGAPLGYLSWDMLGQLAWTGSESIVLFGVVTIALEVAFGRNWISKFGD